MVRRYLCALALLGLLGGVVGCSSSPTATPVPARRADDLPPTAEPAAPSEGDYLERVALVESIEVRILESLPVQVDVVIEGNFRDGCSEIGEITQDVQDGRIAITVTTWRPEDAMCTQALEPFTETYRLDLEGIEPGTYTVDVNGVEEELVVEEAMLGRAEEATLRREALVDDVTLKMTRSIPAQISALIRGNLRDGCSEVSEITQEVVDDRIVIRVITARPEDAMCTQALVPFTETYRLDMEDVPTGTYTVDVNGVETELVWEGAMVGPQAGEYLQREAMIDSVQIQIMESMPVRVMVVMEGDFRDGCSELAGITQQISGDRILITVMTRRPKDAMCTQALVRFTEEYELDLTNVEPGTYTVDVNGVTDTLVLDAEMLGQ